MNKKDKELLKEMDEAEKEWKDSKRKHGSRHPITVAARKRQIEKQAEWRGYNRRQR